MSDTASGAPLSDPERVNVRRYCWYPAFGQGASSFSSWRFFSHYGMLEYRLTNMAPAELGVVRTMLVTIASLEPGVSCAAETLDTDTAAIWKRNQNEVKDRVTLYNQQRMELVHFIGVPPGPAWTGSSTHFVV